MCADCQQTNKYLGQDKSQEKEHALTEKKTTCLQIPKLLRGGLLLLTFETFQFLGQVFFIPVFLVFQVFLRRRRRRRKRGKQKRITIRKNWFYDLNLNQLLAHFQRNFHLCYTIKED